MPALGARITLLTDFGRRDAYVGVLKGVIASIAPEAQVIDLCHEIEPQSLRRGGVVWASATPWFPAGTIHVGIVDPGVGSERRVLAFVAAGSVYLAPDNGLIGYVLPRRSIEAVFEVSRRKYFLPELSRTFHGRDIFAPVAAWLARGVRVEELGPRTTRFAHESLPVPRQRRRGPELELRGEVVDIDRFGNAITNLRSPPGYRLVEIRAAELCLRRLVKTYASVREGRPLALVGSGGTIEISRRNGDAASSDQLRVGLECVARFVPRKTPGARDQASVTG